jgi:hypothetical protein
MSRKKNSGKYKQEGGTPERIRRGSVRANYTQL